MEHKLLNIVADGQDVIAFFRYEDGLEHSKKFKKNTTVKDVLDWGKAHGEEIIAGREEAKRKAEELLLEVTTENNGDILL